MGSENLCFTEHLLSPLLIGRTGEVIPNPVARVSMVILSSVYQLTRTRADISLVVAMRFFECPQFLGVNLKKDSLSTFPLRFRLFLFSLTFPDARGHVRDNWEELPRSIPISCGASRPCACHPIGEHASVAINSSKRTATVPHFTYHLQSNRA